MIRRLALILLVLFTLSHDAQPADTNLIAERNNLRINLSPDGSRYFQVNFLNQTWVRYNESNDGTTLFSRNAPQTFDIGLRRTRIQLFGQITERTFLYFQFGQNNFNNTAGYGAGGTGNRKIAAFFHDALCEYAVLNKNVLKLGGGLTVMNGVSRFSQPSVSSIMTLDVPVFLQYSVDQIDQFDRRLAVYARGQAGRLDYRLYVSNPFPVTTNGQAAPPLSASAGFVNTAAFPNGSGPGIQNQYGGYFAFNLFENENHTTPYMQGTYLGAKKIWNFAAGVSYQRQATWFLRHSQPGALPDTGYSDLLLIGIETFLDMPVNKERGTALNFVAGYYNTNYGRNYLRYNGLMNPGTASTATNLVQSGAYGNAFPMFGTGDVIYFQAGFLLPKKKESAVCRLLPYFSGQLATYEALAYIMPVFDVGINLLFKEHLSKLSLDIQNRPTYYRDTSGAVRSGQRKTCIILQFQIAI